MQENEGDDVAASDNKTERTEVFLVGTQVIEAYYRGRGAEPPPYATSVEITCGDGSLISVIGRNALAKAVIIAEALNRDPIPD